MIQMRNLKVFLNLALAHHKDIRIDLGYANERYLWLINWEKFCKKRLPWHETPSKMDMEVERELEILAYNRADDPNPG